MTTPLRVLPPGRWRPELHAALERMILTYGGAAANPRPLATFDWDNTAIHGDIGESVLMALDAADGGARLATYEHLCDTEGKEVGYPQCAFGIAGLDALEARRLAIDVAERAIADGRMAWRPEIRELIAAMQRHGWEVWVISASAEPLVQAVAQAYGIGADRVVGMRLAVGDDGRFLPRLAGPNTYRRGKLEAIDTFVGRRPTFAAGDADTDIEMLEAARHRLVFDRGHPELRARAEAGGWWLQEPF